MRGSEKIKGDGLFLCILRGDCWGRVMYGRKEFHGEKRLLGKQ